MRGALCSLSSALLRRPIASIGASGHPPLSPCLRSLPQNGRSIGRAWISRYYLSSTVESLVEYERDPPFDDRSVLDKRSSLDLALCQLASDFDKESNLSLGRFYHSRQIPVISTGSLKLDLALGIGGLPKGRMVEIYGKESSGKTTLALHIIKEAQKLGGCCAYFDIENVLDLALAERIGVNIGNLLISRAECAEHSLSIVNTLVNSGSIDVIVVDSVAALIPQCEIESTIDMNRPEVQSRLMTRALRKIHHSLCRSEALIIFINQVRDNVGRRHGFVDQNEITCCGTALRFYAAVRMRARRKCLLYNDNTATGIAISIEIIKNKLAPAMKRADLNIEFGRGLRREEELLEIATKHRFIKKEQDGYWIQGEYYKDQQAAERYLAANNSLTSDLTDLLRDQLFNETTESGRQTEMIEQS
ncbi:DNA repair protein recA homolog 2, mitochondrial-like [Zingiber officinale]|uniref:DNA repair protein recA homolog 2, mitochondrial-like n=1 Tax=Zingiber officinale TaxID=94328 RepID=UPI001C4D07DD|nr:DNA repair protein recA homolog 2, mitochondrial-like [Zingiber officinale]XP_042439823.1 DNA repair protein recA homolog 2, mitochondrial-like [Zingiber officinale]